LQLDYLGGLLISIFNVSLILVLTWGGVPKIGYAWNSPQIIVLIITCLLALILFLIQENFHPLPILQIRLHKIRNVWASYLIITCSEYSTVTLVNFAPVYFQEVLKDSALISGLKTCGFIFGFIAMTFFTPTFVNSNKVHLVMGLSAGLFATCLLVLSFLLSKTLNYVYFFVLTSIMGAGVGFLIPSTGTLVQNTVPQKDIAVAMANYSFNSLIGGIVGVTVSGTIFTRSQLSYLQQGHNQVDATLYGVVHVFIYLVPLLVVASFVGFFLDPPNFVEVTSSEKKQLISN